MDRIGPVFSQFFYTSPARFIQVLLTVYADSMRMKSKTHKQKKDTLFDQNRGLSVAAELGFEPRQHESESWVLPLHNSAWLFRGFPKCRLSLL